MRQIGIVLFTNVEELDAIGPWEVFGHWTLTYPEDGWVVSTLSRDGGSVRCAKGLTITLAWVREQRATVELMTSVCTGSLVYAAAGLLAGRPATTHWGALGELAALDPSIEIRGEDRFVDDGDVITSSGVSAGIDMALHLVARLAGVERARQVRRGIQYDPEPPV